VEKVEKAWEGLSAMDWLQFLPMLLIRIIWWVFCWMRRTYPQVQKKYGGTVGVTAVGMFGKGAGWGIPINDHTIDVTLGGIAEKPGVVDGHIAIGEYLCMTLSMDHTIIDGAPAARFAQQLKELIESGYGLCESEPVYLCWSANIATWRCNDEPAKDSCRSGDHGSDCVRDVCVLPPSLAHPVGLPAQCELT